MLHAFLEWDTDAFARLDGIFAFALWQKAERRLVLVRDRLGVKPLFCCPTRSGLVFGSTIDTVLCHPEAEPVLDEDGLRPCCCSALRGRPKAAYSAAYPRSCPAALPC